MVSEEKVKIMTRLAIYEQKESEAIDSAKYSRDDYVSKKMITTGILVSLCYLLMIIVVVLCKVDYLMENITEMDIWSVGRKIVIIYVALVAVYMLLAYIVYTLKYKVMETSNKGYVEELKRLTRIYRKEEKEKGKLKLGGAELDDDETFDF